MGSASLKNDYLNSISRLIVIIDEIPFPQNQLFALHDFERIQEETYCLFVSNWDKGIDGFIAWLKEKVEELEHSSDQKKFIEAYELCTLLDERISYSKKQNSSIISLWELVPIEKNKPIVRTTPLNTNYAQTNIELHPKFNVYDVYEYPQEGYEEDKRNVRSTSIKDAFLGINGQLKNLCYSKRNNCNLSVTDILIDFPDNVDRDYITIAFSPMTDQDVLNKTKSEIVSEGFSFDVTCVEGIKESQYDSLLNRFDNAWNAACENEADILFFPESLGLLSLEHDENSYHLHIKELSDIAMGNGYNPPKIVFLPSVSSNNSNSVSIAYQDGRHLGKQKKQRPFVDRNEHRMEPFSSESQPNIIILHMVDVHRIAMMICSDFLTCPAEIQQKMFAEFGVTLLLVPSYSKGEQDFLGKLSDYKKYGTTVIWGNCCAAAGLPSIRGGCSIAALESIKSFAESDDKCKCNCTNGCIYLIKVPIHIKRKAKGSADWNDYISQVLL